MSSPIMGVLFLFLSFFFFLPWVLLQLLYRKQYHRPWTIAMLLSYLKLNHTLRFARAVHESCCPSLFVHISILLSKASNLHNKSYGHPPNKQPQWLISAQYDTSFRVHKSNARLRIEQLCRYSIAFKKPKHWPLPRPARGASLFHGLMIFA